MLTFVVVVPDMAGEVKYTKMWGKMLKATVLVGFAFGIFKRKGRIGNSRGTSAKNNVCLEGQ